MASVQISLCLLDEPTEPYIMHIILVHTSMHSPRLTCLQTHPSTCLHPTQNADPPECSCCSSHPAAWLPSAVGGCAWVCSRSSSRSTAHTHCKNTQQQHAVTMLGAQWLLGASCVEPCKVGCQQSWLGDTCSHHSAVPFAGCKQGDMMCARFW